MYIHKLHIKEFGALRDREFSLSHGINLFEGDNESGKSTLLGFIRFMLYGMPRRTAGEGISERDRGLSWENGVAEGSMELSSQGKRYRIERQGRLKSTNGHDTYSEKCNIYACESGEEVFVGEIPGKIFLGIPNEVFLSTACIRQLECSDMSGDDINASIENLLFSANEEIDTAKVQSRLDDLRKTMLYKNGKGGRIFELETEKSLLETRLENAKQSAETIIAKEASVEHYKAVSEKAKKQSEEAEATLRVYDTAATLLRFEKLHGYEAQHKEAENALETLCREKGYRDALPDRDTLSVIERFSGTLQDAVQKKALAEASLRGAEGAKCGDRTLAGFYAKTDEEGGADSVCSAFLRSRKKRRRSTALGVLFLSFGALFAGVGVFTTLSDLFASYYSTIPYFPFLALGVGLTFCVGGLLSLVNAGKAKKRCAVLIEKIGMSLPKITENALIAHIENCRANYELCRQYDNNLSTAKASYDNSVSELERTMENTVRMLSSVGISELAKTPETLSATLKKTYTDFHGICAEREKIEGKLDSLAALISELTRDLEDKNEAVLSASIQKREPRLILNEIDLEKVKLSYEYGKTQHTLSEQKKLALEKELIALTSTAENPARLEAKLASTISELEACRLRYEALVLAHSTLGISSENLRRNITPRLRIRAGELLEKLTSGKYGKLGVSPEMKITVLTEGRTRDIDSLSKGTRDAAYITLRIALAELICKDSMPPLIFDESFTQLDDTRTFAMLNMLFEYTGENTQSLIFTCHKREGEMLRRIGNFSSTTLK